jgi:hypothetical protein
MKGAYYTPDDVVQFIVEDTLTSTILQKVKEGLAKSGWSEADIQAYNTLDSVYGRPPKNPKDIDEVIHSLDTIKVLDPACGSGHFLTAAPSEILRIEEFLLRSVGEEADRYNLKNKIVSRNIFGVDIDENAVEIAQLRLWLFLIEDWNQEKHSATLPNIDFNIFVGNSLIGWLNETFESPLITSDVGAFFNAEAGRFKGRYPQEVAAIKGLLEQGKLEPTLAAYHMLVKIYTLESGMCAEDLQEMLNHLRKELYAYIRAFYVGFIRDNSDISKAARTVLIESLGSRHPFHWLIDFEAILTAGGFDVIIGNPPYILDKDCEDLDIIITKLKKTSWKGKKADTHEPLFYQCQDCGNTYAYFIERSLKLLKEGGKFGFIVPASVVATKSMETIRDYMYHNCSELNYFHFDDRPGKIFRGLEHCRSTIAVAERGEREPVVRTSKYHRWYDRDRPTLFENLKTVDIKIAVGSDPIPKIGSETEKSIMGKLNLVSEASMLGDESDGNTRLWWYRTPGNYIHAHNESHVPRCEYATGEACAKLPEHYKSLYVPLSDSDIVLGLLNSSLFYWWWTVWSTGRNVDKQLICEFPIDVQNFPNKLKHKLSPLVEDLMVDFDRHSYKRLSTLGHHDAFITEYWPGSSKAIIAKIDCIFAEYYRLTDEERDFVINFDADIRNSDLAKHNKLDIN